MNNSLQIGVVQSAAVQLLPGWMRRLRILNPNVTIKLHEGTNSDVVAWTLADVVEVGITSWTHPDLNSRVVHEDNFVAAVPITHALATETSIDLKRLDGERLLVPSSGYETLIEEQLAAAASYPEIVGLVGDNATLISMVRAGLGLTLLPEIALGDCDGVKVVRVHPTFQHRIYALTKRQKILPPTGMIFLSIAQSP